MQAPRDGEQDRVAGRDAEPVIDLLEAVDVDDEHSRPDLLLRLGDRDDRLKPVQEQLAVGQAGEIVVHGVVQQPLLGLLLLGDVDHRADAADDLAVRPDDRAGSQREPVVVPVGAAQAEALRDLAAAMFEHDVERGPERVAVVGMQHRQPVAGGSAEAVRRQPELQADVGLGDHAVAQHVPVPDDVA